MPLSKKLIARTQKPGKKVFHQEGGVKELTEFCKIWAIKNTNESTSTVCFIEAEIVAQTMTRYISEKVHNF